MISAQVIVFVTVGPDPVMTILSPFLLFLGKKKKYNYVSYTVFFWNKQAPVVQKLQDISLHWICH